MNENLKWAMYYVHERKWSVIPLRPGEKKPNLKEGEVLPYRERLPSDQELTRWFVNPRMNIGIITGTFNNLFVVDLDKSKDKYIEENAIIHFGDNINTPISETPSGGNHLYFTYPGHNITIGEGILPAIDYRGEGGYIVAPPSKNGKGTAYKWIQSIKEFALGEVPQSFIDILNNKSTIYGRDTSAVDNSVTGVTPRDIWVSGERDKNLFHVSYCLSQTKNSTEYVRQTLRAIILSWGERDEKWIDAKIKSAMERLERKERNLQAEIDTFIGVTEGDFSVTSLDNELGIVTPRDKATRRKCLSRRKDITIQKVGMRDGWWRRIDTDFEHLDFSEEQGVRSGVLLPLELSSLVEICEGNLVLISGEYNAGKTSFALNVLQMNKNRIKIRYVSSEMGPGEMKKRWKTFPDLPESFWLPDEMTEYVRLRNNLPTLILPDGLTIIDYLEFRDGDYTLGGEYLRQIHDKLQKGVCLICNQQKEGVRLPRAGDLVMEKPRLAITLRKVNNQSDDVVGIAEIQKAKNVILGKMDGKRLKYQLLNRGSKFKVLVNWGWWKETK